MTPAQGSPPSPIGRGRQNPAGTRAMPGPVLTRAAAADDGGFAEKLRENDEQGRCEDAKSEDDGGATPMTARYGKIARLARQRPNGFKVNQGYSRLAKNRATAVGRKDSIQPRTKPGLNTDVKRCRPRAPTRRSWMIMTPGRGPGLHRWIAPAELDKMERLTWL